MVKTYQHTSDKELWNLLLNGNKHVLETIYKRHYDLLLNYGVKIYPDEELIKDCIQDVFVKIHTSTHLNPTQSVKSYLLKSLKNILYDRLATLKDTADIEEYTFQLRIEDSMLQKLFDKNDADFILGKKLIKAYSSLSENQKQIIYLRYIKELSYKEIAEILDITPQSSMNLLSRTLTKLRESMRDKKILLIFF